MAQPNNPVVWFEIYVQDLPRAKRFYETVLGVTLEKLNSPIADMELWAFPSTQNGTGAAGALVKMAGVTPGGMGTLVYFAVPGLRGGSRTRGRRRRPCAAAEDVDRRVQIHRIGRRSRRQHVRPALDDVVPV